MRAANLSMSVSAVMATCLAGACTNFDREDRIQDMRVLAIKTEPAEILYSPLYLTSAAQRPPIPLPSTDVKVEVFAFDPRGGRTQTSFQVCPAGVTDSTCRLYDPTEDLAAEPAAARDELRTLLTPQVFTGTIDDTTRPVGAVSPSTFQMAFTPNVIDFIIPDDSSGNPVPSIFPLLPRFVVEDTNLDEQAPAVVKERAFKRIPVTLDLTSSDLPPDVAAGFARSLGINLCTAPIPDSVYQQQGRADCLEKRVPNNNPVLEGLFFDNPELLTEGTLTTADVTPDVGPTSVLIANAGAKLALTPIFAPGTVEKYQVVSFDIQASKIILLNRIEDIACNWYSTRGDVSQSLTATQFLPSLGMTWTLPSDAKSGERDSLILVVLDQRGGTAVGEVTVEYR